MEPKNPQPKSDNELGIFTRFFDKIGAQVAEIITNIKRISHYAHPIEDALIAYPSTPVTVATPIKPGNPDVLAVGGAAGYDRVLIFFNGQRISNKVWVINAGPGSLFVIASYNLIKWSGEDEILLGEWRAFTSVYELRVRSPDATTSYRVTEYEPGEVCCGSTAPLNILSNVTINASTANTSASIDVRGYKYMIITLRATMNAGATADPAATVEVITSIDNVSFDNVGVYDYVTAISLALSAGNTRQKTSNLIDLRGIYYTELVTTNQDAAQALTGVYVDIVLVR